MTDHTLACTLGPKEFQERRAFILREIVSGVVSTKELSDGYEFQFPASSSWIKTLVEFIEFERTCCSFLSFQLSIPSQQNNMSLAVTGPCSAKDFIRTELNLTKI